MILVGSTTYTWSGDDPDDVNGESDFAAVRLDEIGEVVWSYQVELVFSKRE